MLKICQKIHFAGNLCYHDTERLLGYKNKELFGIAPLRQGSITLMLTAVATVAA